MAGRSAAATGPEWIRPGTSLAPTAVPPTDASPSMPDSHAVDVHHLPTRGPGDVDGLSTLIDSGRLPPEDIVAILGKTEGNGCVNDFTREYATTAVAQCLATRLGIPVAEAPRRIAIVMSGGTEGVLSPHLSVFSRRRVGAEAAATDGRPKRLAIGIAFTREFAPEEIGRHAQIVETASAVRRAMADAGIERASDLHFVQIKCPLLSAARVQEATGRGSTTITQDTYESMGYSRGASALGVAMATGEVSGEMLDAVAVLSDTRLYSSIASASAGIELAHNVVIALGMSRQAVGECVIAHDVMHDAIDAAAVERAMARVRSLGANRVVNVLAKAEASPDGRIRGERHTMLDDSDIHSTRHARAAVGAVIASVVGRCAVYVSGGAEHQGPPGGGPVAVIGRVG